MSNTDPQKIFEADYDYLKQQINKLNFINGVAIYYDPMATLRRSNGYQNNWENNFGIITSDGFFIQDKIAMRMDRFYNQLLINGYGLFELTRKDYNSFSEDKTSYHKYIFDTEGNYLSEYDFERLILILSNRNQCLSPEKFIEMIPDLKEGIFKIVDGSSNIWREKDGEYNLEFEREREDGLFFYTEEYSRPRSDSYTEFQYVRDRMGNKMYLNEFYQGLLMLDNGKKYLTELTNQFIIEQLGYFK